MRPYFKRFNDIASSSSVEAEFCDLKHRAFKRYISAIKQAKHDV